MLNVMLAAALVGFGGGKCNGRGCCHGGYYGGYGCCSSYGYYSGGGCCSSSWGYGCCSSGWRHGRRHGCCSSGYYSGCSSGCYGGGYSGYYGSTYGGYGQVIYSQPMYAGQFQNGTVVGTQGTTMPGGAAYGAQFNTTVQPGMAGQP